MPSASAAATRSIDTARRMLGQGSIADALALLGPLSASAPEHAEAQHYFGLALHMGGRSSEALPLFERAIALDPNNASIRQNQVMALLATGDAEAAVAAGRAAVKLSATSMGAWRNLVLALCRTGQWEEAATAAQASSALDPNNSIPLTQLGHIRMQQGADGEAEALLRRAVALAPGDHEALYNLGVVLQRSGREAEACGHFSAVLKLDAANKAARINLGVALRNIGKPEAALAVWAESPIPPEQWPELAYNIACAKLLMGDWAGAWADYGLRTVTLPPAPVRTTSETQVWTGETIAGTLLVVHEQGLGDTFQFVRLLPAIRERVGELVFVCQAPLFGLLSSMTIFASGQAKLLRQGEAVPLHDRHVQLMSLPGILGLTPETVPGRGAYLSADAGRRADWKAKLAALEPAEMRIGLAWQGNPQAPVDRGRSLALAEFAPLAGIDGVKFLSLQKGVAADAQAPAGLKLDRLEIDVGPDAFLDSAALGHELDLVVTSDSALAHVMGALGRPVWLLLKHIPDWRWGISGRVSPWYSSIRVFRQGTSGDWAGVMAEVASELRALLALRRGAGLAAGEVGGELLAKADSANRARQYGAAIADYRRLAVAYPDESRVLNRLGLALFEAGRRSPQAVAEALPIALRSVALAPQSADHFSNLAVVLDQTGDKADGTRALHHALALDPAHVPSQLALANREIAAGRAEAALERTGAVLSADPASGNALSIHAAALTRLGRLDEAIAALRQAVALEPGSARMLVQLGAVLSQAKDLDGARVAWEQALVIDPQHADALSNLGVDERTNGLPGLAAWFLRSAVKSDPNHAEAWSNLGIGALEDGREDEAMAAFRRAIAIRPDYADARMALGMSLMNTGQYEEGLPQYEWRLKVEKLGLKSSMPRLPLWQGEDPRGKKFLIIAEQGFGDAFQFVRYAALLKAAGAETVMVGCRGKLASLMRGASGVDGVVPENAPIPPLDYCVYMMSLPLRLGTRVETIPNASPYLKADPAKVSHWAKVLAEKPGLRVGLVWQGNPDPQVDKGRSFPLARLKPLTRIPGVRLIALQKGPGEEQIAANAGFVDVETLGADFDTGPDAFADTAAAIMNLDLVITSDTAVAHLAAGLGRPTWVVIKASPEWRWLRDRSDSPWYPSVRLFRRIEGEVEDADFAGVFERVAGALAKLAAGDRSVLYETRPMTAEVAVIPPAEERFRTALAGHLAGEGDAAAEVYARLIVEHPNFAEAFHLLGAVALQKAGYAGALILFRQAEALGLKSAELRTNMASALRHLGRVDAAEVLLRGLIEEQPTAEALTTLGNLLRDKDRFDEAAGVFERAIGLRPELDKAHRGLGNSLKDLGRIDGAVAALDRAVELAPEDSEGRLDRAHARLMAGDLVGGFSDYEVRWTTQEMVARDIGPRWDGKGFAGKTLLIHGEQGIGDQIQFARFIKAAAQLGGRTIVEVRAPLVTLFEGLDVGGADVRIVPQGFELPAFDMQVPMMSLPFVQGIGLEDLPGQVPTFTPDAKRVAAWRKSLGGGKKLRVGLVWQGNPQARADKGRSVPLEKLAPLFKVPGVHIVALQHGDGLEQVAGFAHADKLEVLGDRLGDFADTAAAMAAMDLVVSSCTSAIHLAGAVGVPAFVMLRSNADWRWMTGRDDSPWYPGMTLFRQQQAGDWDGVAKAVAKALKARAK